MRLDHIRYKKNVCNTESWSVIRRSMAEVRLTAGFRRLVGTYLDGRLVVKAAEETLRMIAGVLYGSLWNLLYDPAVLLDLPEGCKSSQTVRHF